MVPRTISTGIQDFEKLRLNNAFYVDKTMFIKEWWESLDDVTLITRPRRFGKTLNMSMMECFWSTKYVDKGNLFEGLSIWQEEKYRNLQGTYPVIALSFANVKEDTYAEAAYKICKILKRLVIQHSYLLDSEILTAGEKKAFWELIEDVSIRDATTILHDLSGYLYHHYGRKVIILLDEYDTPMQEAYVKGYWGELVSFIRNMFNDTFKTNPYLERAIMTGITRISKESMFSDLNNLHVVSSTSDEYATCFGFTEEEVFSAMTEFDLTNKDEVKQWYDGFAFGEHRDIYNPWSIINFLRFRKLKTYWVNTSSNNLAGKLIREGNASIKVQFEQLLSGRALECFIDEEIVYNQLDNKNNSSAVWSLLLASGYLKVQSCENDLYRLRLTNYEVTKMFRTMIISWFNDNTESYGEFVTALLVNDLKKMNEHMNKLTQSMFSFFDTGSRSSGQMEPECFYHGFVLGLIASLFGKYVITSNRESGNGRYDVMLEPLNKDDDGMILEFKVYNPRKEKSLDDTVFAALNQIEEKNYEQTLLDHGVKKEKIRKYGFAFEGKKVLIGSDIEKYRRKVKNDSCQEAAKEVSTEKMNAF